MENKSFLYFLNTCTQAVPIAISEQPKQITKTTTTDKVNLSSLYYLLQGYLFTLFMSNKTVQLKLLTAGQFGKNIGAKLTTFAQFQRFGGRIKKSFCLGLAQYIFYDVWEQLFKLPSKDLIIIKQAGNVINVTDKANSFIQYIYSQNETQKQNFKDLCSQFLLGLVQGLARQFNADVIVGIDTSAPYVKYKLQFTADWPRHFDNLTQI